MMQRGSSPVTKKYIFNYVYMYVTVCPNLFCMHVQTISRRGVRLHADWMRAGSLQSMRSMVRTCSVAHALSGRTGCEAPKRHMVTLKRSLHKAVLSV